MLIFDYSVHAMIEIIYLMILHCYYTRYLNHLSFNVKSLEVEVVFKVQLTKKQ